MNNQSIEILNIPFTTLRESEVLKLLEKNFRENSKQLFLATPNPEMLLASKKNPQFQKILQQTSLNLPDGNGLIWAKIFQDKVAHRHHKLPIILQGIGSLITFIWHPKNTHKPFNQAIHGSDLTIKICSSPTLSRQPIFLLGNSQGLRPDTAKYTAEILQKRYPGIKIAGYHDGRPTDQNLLEKINNSNAKILLVGFGAPHQETWLAENLPHLPKIKLAMGIGGTFDFISGILPRAPHWMRKTGLEWLYRLIKQPKRIGRIFNATIVFPYTVIKDRLANHHKHNT
jgi:N-acetylglucosaminyldiphosphoundecaprenol N-acetyl-beta-D-mannosaminyltransferase